MTNTLSIHDLPHSHAPGVLETDSYTVASRHQAPSETMSLDSLIAMLPGVINTATRQGTREVIITRCDRGDATDWPIMERPLYVGEIYVLGPEGLQHDATFSVASRDGVVGGGMNLAEALTKFREYIGLGESSWQSRQVKLTWSVEHEAAPLIEPSIFSDAAYTNKRRAFTRFPADS